MNTECTRTKLMFHGLGGRQVVGRFAGGEITSDGGGVLLREAEHRTRILGRLSQCLTDHRDPDRIEHSVEGLIKQRVLGLCLGYEDLNDHDELCRDRLLALLCDRDDLTGELRRVESDRGAAHGVVLELKRIVALLREAWPQVRITVRGDSGFCNDELMVWCEAEGIDYVLGRAKNARLKERIAREMAAARQLQQASGKAGRQFQELRYRTLESWSCERRVVAKVESLPRGENPRFIVTSVAVTEWEGRRLYEEVYCARGDMENRIKEQQLGLFADRTSSSQMQANQLRLYFRFRLRDGADVTPGGAGGDETGAGAVLDPACETTEDRGSDPGHHSQGLAVLFRELSIRGVVEDGSGAHASPPASVLARNGKNSLEDGALGLPQDGLCPGVSTWGRGVAQKCMLDVKCLLTSLDLAARRPVWACKRPP